MRLFQEILEAAEEDRYPNLKNLRVHSVALPNCSDSKSEIRIFEGLEKASALRQYFEEVAKTSSSLLTTCEDNNRTHLVSVYSLVTLKKIFGQRSTEENSIFVRAATKIELLISRSGTFPDFRTIRDVLHECIDNSTDQFRKHHLSLKVLADAVCTYLSLYLTGQPRDSCQILDAFRDLVNSHYNLRDLDRSALASVLYVFRFLFHSSQYDGDIDGDEDDNDEMEDDNCDDNEMDDDDDDDSTLNSCFETLRSWVERTVYFSDSARPHFLSILEALILSVQSHLRGQQLDLQQVRTSLYQSIDDDPEVSESNRPACRYFVSSLCICIECLVNHPDNLQSLHSELHKLIESLPDESVTDVGKPVLQSCVDVCCPLIECLFKKPPNLTQVRDTLHNAIDHHCDPSDKDYEDYKLLASVTCELLQYLMSARLTLLSMYSLQTRPQENSQLRELKLLMYKLRKRGIHIYMHYTRAR